MLNWKTCSKNNQRESRQAYMNGEKILATHISDKKKVNPQNI